MASGIQSSLLSAREKALLGQYDDALTFFDGVVADVQVLLRTCDSKDKAQWLMFKEKVQEEATLVKDISSVVTCFKDQPGRVNERGGNVSRRNDAEAAQVFSDKDVNSFPSRQPAQKQAVPRARAAEQSSEQRCEHLVSRHLCPCRPRYSLCFLDKSSFPAGPASALWMRALPSCTRLVPLPPLRPLAVVHTRRSTSKLESEVMGMQVQTPLRLPAVEETRRKMKTSRGVSA
jgi:hypothetical protein